MAKIVVNSEKMKAARISQGLRLEDLATKLSISVPSLRKYETGECSKAHLGNLKKWIEFFGFRTKDIISVVKEKKGTKNEN